MQNSSQIISTDFLDVNLNSKSGLHKPYRKPNDETVYIINSSQHIGRLARMSVLDTEVDGSNPGSSMLFS